MPLRSFHLSPRHGLVGRAAFGETAGMHRLRFALEFVGCAAAGALAGAVFHHDDTVTELFEAARFPDAIVYRRPEGK